MQYGLARRRIVYRFKVVPFSPFFLYLVGWFISDFSKKLEMFFRQTHTRSIVTYKGDDSPDAAFFS